MIKKLKKLLKSSTPFFITKVDGTNYSLLKDSFPQEIQKKQTLKTYENVYLHVPTGTLYKKNFGIISDSKIGWGRIRRTGLLHTKKPEFKKVKKIDFGSTIYCGSSKSGFYHWLIECIPRAELLKNNIPVFLPELSILNEKILNSIYPDLNVKYEKSEWLYFEKFSLPLFYALPGKGYIPNNFRKRILSKINYKKDIDILFISRSKAQKRRILNEEFLIKKVSNNRKVKNVSLELYEFDRQLEYVNRSKLIIAPHGAGLSNLVAASNNAIVLEILPSNDRPMDFYKCLCKSIKVDYHSVLIENLVGRHSNYSLSCNDIEFIENFIIQKFNTNE